MIQESYLHLGDECYFMVHSELMASRPTLLFLHGLGDAHLHYRSYLTSELIKHYNILVPDLLGYGKSSASEDYRIERQVKGIEQQIHHLQKTSGVSLSNFILIAHSMGGIHATLLCKSAFKNAVKAFINIEGSVTQFSSFISKSVATRKKEESFSEWFNAFKQQKIYENLGLKYPCMRSYYAALEFCQPEAFLKNALEIYEMSNAGTGPYTHIIGKAYAELTIPRIYCYGDSMCEETLAFLSQNQLASRYFSGKTHFILDECFNEFVIFIHEYVKSLLF